MVMKKRTKKALKPAARRARTKTKKPKFLSLRHQLSSEKPQQQSTEMFSSATNHRQLNLFPLHPENSTEDKDTHDDQNMAYLFSAADGGATTLTGLLGSSTTSSSHDHEDNVTTNCTTTLSSSVSLSYAYGAQDSEEGALVRTALRNKERDASEERWVCYSEVVERRSDEEVTSCAVYDERKLQRLALKLDYQEILNAWSDRGSLYIHAECPQTVPDICDDFLPHDTSNGIRDCWGSNVGVWRVPEMTTNDTKGGIRYEEGQVGEELKLGQREASVLRYKEKRQNRLFAKRIRYEVRKLNAEKRPRVKGRFVKRS